MGCGFGSFLPMTDNFFFQCHSSQKLFVFGPHDGQPETCGTSFQTTHSFGHLDPAQFRLHLGLHLVLLFQHDVAQTIVPGFHRGRGFPNMHVQHAASMAACVRRAAWVLPGGRRTLCPCCAFVVLGGTGRENKRA